MSTFVLNYHHLHYIFTICITKSTCALHCQHLHCMVCICITWSTCILHDLNLYYMVHFCFTYQRDNLKPYIEELQTMQLMKEKEQTTFCKIFHRKLKIAEHETHQKICACIVFVLYSTDPHIRDKSCGFAK